MQIVPFASSLGAPQGAPLAPPFVTGAPQALLPGLPGSTSGNASGGEQSFARELSRAQGESAERAPQPSRPSNPGGDAVERQAATRRAAEARAERQAAARPAAPSRPAAQAPAAEQPAPSSKAGTRQKAEDETDSTDESAAAATASAKTPAVDGEQRDVSSLLAALLGLAPPAAESPAAATALEGGPRMARAGRAGAARDPLAGTKAGLTEAGGSAALPSSLASRIKPDPLASDAAPTGDAAGANSPSQGRPSRAAAGAADAAEATAALQAGSVQLPSAVAEPASDTLQRSAAPTASTAPAGADASAGAFSPVALPAATSAVNDLRGSAAPAPAAPFEAQLAAALGSPDFAPALGRQLSVMVQDGIQQARLHLNPAELGPITVQIALDGSAAQIHMAAEHALTREALEQAMPTLASALREDGLTLTGGGVFEQPREPQRDGRQDDDSRGSPTASGSDRPEDTPAAAAPLANRTLRGVVDLIA